MTPDYTNDDQQNARVSPDQLLDQLWSKLPTISGRGGPREITREQLGGFMNEALAHGGAQQFARSVISEKLAEATLVNDVTRFLGFPMTRVVHPRYANADCTVHAAVYDAKAGTVVLTIEAPGAIFDKVPLGEVVPAGPIADTVRTYLQTLMGSMLRAKLEEAGMRDMLKSAPRPDDAVDCERCATTGVCGTCAGRGWYEAGLYDDGKLQHRAYTDGTVTEYNPATGEQRIFDRPGEAEAIAAAAEHFGLGAPAGVFERMGLETPPMPEVHHLQAHDRYVIKDGKCLPDTDDDLPLCGV